MGHNQFMFVYSDIVYETCLIFVFSMLSLMSQLGILCLGISFFSNSLAQRLATLFMSKARELFSGEPSMTLKVNP